ncbi:TauD/TfdA family dioxygenase [Kribbella sp. NBC_00709]|uniref:TauD/TfdA family dioxygenase n=1 Tax=Kribbella sp. NBC_00709 TaxID=2975972 RepID=UPI002E2CC618|nr:TauD/TfdA family dioxygenase [Kribbella sp. NBC_00709]
MLIDEVDRVADRLRRNGFALTRSTAPDSDALTATAEKIGRSIGTSSMAVWPLKSTGADVWLERHTENITDSDPLRYFALGCVIPSATGGETCLFDGRKAARLLLDRIPSAPRVRIRYRSSQRGLEAVHNLIEFDDAFGPILRFRSECHTNSVLDRPSSLSEPELYEAVEEALTASLSVSHSWLPGDFLIVDNTVMLHSRAPFSGSRQMLRFRFDDPHHPAISFEGATAAGQADRPLELQS